MSTYNDASLIYYPSGYKAGKAYSLKPTDGSGDLDFTRASTATRVNESGLIEEVAANVPRLDNSQGGCSTLLLEPQRTNLFVNSTNNLTYLGSGVVDNSAGTSPSGDVDAQKVTFGAGVNDGASLGINTAVSSSTNYILTFYAKSVVGDGTFKVRVDTNTTTGIVQPIITATSEWVRYEILITTGGTDTAITTTSRLRPETASNEVLFWGFDLQAGSYPTSYIPTSGTAVTRVADAASKSGISSLIGQTEGTIYLEGDIQKHNESGFYVTISNGATINTAIYAYQPSNGNLQVLVRKSGNPDATLTITSANWTAGFNKLAIAYTSTTAEVFINGVSKGTTSFVSAPACSKFTIGSRPDAVGTLVGTGGYNQAILFPTRLTNTDLAALTTL